MNAIQDAFKQKTDLSRIARMILFKSCIGPNNTSACGVKGCMWLTQFYFLPDFAQNHLEIPLKIRPRGVGGGGGGGSY